MNTDVFSSRLIAFTVCLMGMVTVVAVATRDNVSDNLDRLAFLVAGGLIGALTTRRHSSDDTQSVSVDNPQTDPVPTEPE